MNNIPKNLYPIGKKILHLKKLMNIFYLKGKVIFARMKPLSGSKISHKEAGKAILNHKEAERAYGQEVARKYIQRINIVKQSRNLEELKALPGLHCHSLKGDRRGQWAIKLTGFFRLIFTLEGETVEIVRIEEVSKHYDD